MVLLEPADGLRGAQDDPADAGFVESDQRAVAFLDFDDAVLNWHPAAIIYARRLLTIHITRQRSATFLLSPIVACRHFDDMQPLTPDEIRRAVQAALAEDIGSGDVTSLATVPETAVATASMRAREPLVVAGLELAEAAFRELSTAVQINRLAKDGQRVGADTVLLRVSGPARALLAAERVALNFVQRLSGVATLTAQFVDAVKGTPARIFDTRKTTPGWRRLENTPWPVAAASITALACLTWCSSKTIT